MTNEEALNLISKIEELLKKSAKYRFIQYDNEKKIKNEILKYKNRITESEPSNLL